MIEQGLVKLIQTGLTDAFSQAVPGGYATELPKDLIGVQGSQVFKAWLYRSMDRPGNYVLQGIEGLTNWTVQIDCYGYNPSDAIDLGYAIDAIVNGFSGTLTDSDSTVVEGIFRQGSLIDSFSDVNRAYVRSLEFLVQYYQI